MIYILVWEPERAYRRRDRSEQPLAYNPEHQLQAGIDVKYLVLDFLREIKENHGDRRARRLASWIHDGGYYVHSLSYARRRELHSDIKRLGEIIRKYRE